MDGSDHCFGKGELGTTAVEHAGGTKKGQAGVYNDMNSAKELAFVSWAGWNHSVATCVLPVVYFEMNGHFLHTQLATCLVIAQTAAHTITRCTFRGPWHFNSYFICQRVRVEGDIERQLGGRDHVPHAES
jgi:hypothetical protein